MVKNGGMGMLIKEERQTTETRFPSLTRPRRRGEPGDIEVVDYSSIDQNRMGKVLALWGAKLLN
jgi:hypothetical protein